MSGTHLGDRSSETTCGSPKPYRCYFIELAHHKLIMVLAVHRIGELHDLPVSADSPLGYPPFRPAKAGYDVGVLLTTAVSVCSKQPRWSECDEASGGIEVV